MSSERSIPPTNDPVLGRVVMSYRIDRLIGRGGMGAVYKAIDSTTGTVAAVKVLLPDLSSNQVAIKRFLNEIRAVATLNHPGLVSFKGHGTFSDGVAYILMEFIDGQSLKTVLSDCKINRQLLPTDHVLDIGIQVSKAMIDVHLKNYIHRDLTPANILLMRESTGAYKQVKVVDFGLAQLDEGDASTGRTTIGRFVGTALYASPEQCEMSGEVTSASDVYSLGVTLFELVAGRPPFMAEKPGIIIAQHQLQEPPALAKLAPNAPRELCSLIHRMLAKSASQRPTMIEVHECLTRVQTDSGGGHGTNNRPLAHYGVLVGGVLVASGAVALLWNFSVRSRGHSPALVTTDAAVVVDQGNRPDLAADLGPPQSIGPSTSDPPPARPSHPSLPKPNGGTSKQQGPRAGVGKRRVTGPQKPTASRKNPQPAQPSLVDDPNDVPR